MKKIVVLIVNKILLTLSFFPIFAIVDRTRFMNAEYSYDEKQKELRTFLHRVYRQTGLLMDETYSGKAFFGMMQEIKNKGLSDKKILFWMTGGPLNAIS